MRRVFRVVRVADLTPAGTKATTGFTVSVRDNGVIAPLLLAEVVDPDGVIRLEIIDGNRRVRAAREAKQETVPAVVLKETTAAERARLTLICNQLRSSNFLTESRAATALAPDVAGIEREARIMGLSASTVLAMVDRLERMPGPVRQAMDEGRLPVGAATEIAGFPRPLQEEIVALLEERGWLDTRTVTAMQEDWQARGGERHAPAASPPATTGPQRAQAPTREPVATAEWSAAPAPVSTAQPTVGTVAFVARMDSALRELAREATARGVPRAVWVDRSTRAWARAERGEG